jgi:hypothetical protein
VADTLLRPTGKSLRHLQTALDEENPHAEGGFVIPNTKVTLRSALSTSKSPIGMLSESSLQQRVRRMSTWCLARITTTLGAGGFEFDGLAQAKSKRCITVRMIMRLGSLRHGAGRSAGAKNARSIRSVFAAG